MIASPASTTNAGHIAGHTAAAKNVLSDIPTRAQATGITTKTARAVTGTSVAIATPGSPHKWMNHTLSATLTAALIEFEIATSWWLPAPRRTVLAVQLPTRTSTTIARILTMMAEAA